MSKKLEFSYLKKGRCDMEQCCGTCKFHVPGEVPGEGDWVCNNGESEYYGLETGYDDGCMDWEERD